MGWLVAALVVAGAILVAREAAARIWLAMFALWLGVVALTRCVGVGAFIALTVALLAPTMLSRGR